MTDWPTIHAKVVEQFRTGWERPGPHAWDGFIGASMRFVQPMLPNGVGAEHWWAESSRILALLPDLRAEVLDWSGSGESLFIHLRFSATLAGRPMTWEAVDLLRVSPEGQAVFRESFFDSVPVAATVIRRPRAWLRWWRSGVGPLLARRRLLRPVPVPSTNTGGSR
jgi:hypothetical protein